MSDNIEIVVDVKGITEVTAMGTAFARMTEAFNSLSKIEKPLQSLQSEIKQTAEIAKTLQNFKASDSSISSFKAMSESIKEMGRASIESNGVMGRFMASISLSLQTLTGSVSTQVSKIDALLASMGTGGSAGVSQMVAGIETKLDGLVVKAEADAVKFASSFDTAAANLGTTMTAAFTAMNAQVAQQLEVLHAKLLTAQTEQIELVAKAERNKSEVISASHSKNLTLNARYAEQLQSAELQIQAKGTSGILSRLEARGREIERILLADGEKGKAIAIKTYGSDFVASIEQGMGKARGVLKTALELELEMVLAHNREMAIARSRAFAPSMANAINSAQGAYQQYDPATGAQGAVVYASAQTEAQARIYDAARDAEYAKTVAHLNAKNELYLANQAAQGKIFDAARDAEYVKAQANLLAQGKLYDAHKDKLYANKLEQGKLFDAARDAEYVKTQASLTAQAALYDAHRDKLYANKLAQGKLFDAARDAEYIKVQNNLKAQALLYDAARDARFAKDVAAMQKLLGMGGLLTGLTGAGTQLTGVMQGLARGFQMVTTTGTHLVAMLAGFGAAAASMKALHVGSEVAENLADIQHLAGASKEEIQKLSEAISTLAQSSSYGPVEAAKALQVLALAGLNATESLVALRPTLNFSITGGMEIEKSAESLVAITTAYGYSASGIATVADVIAKAAAVSMASVDAMTNSFRVASVVAQQYGVTLEDSAMSLMFLSQIGIKGTAAGTAMTNFYTQMMAGTGPAVKAMKQLGLTMIDTTTNSAKPLVQIVTELDVALRKYTYSEQMAYIQKITTNRGSKELAALLVAYRNNLHETNPALETHIAELRKAGKEEEALRLEKELSITTFKKYQEALKDSAGFNDIAAAGKSYTPHQQGEAIKASFTGDLNDAFTKSADAVYLLGDAILKVFRSDEFRQMIDTMVSGITAFVTSLVEGFTWITKNKDAIADWVVTAATWAAVIGSGVLVITGLVGAVRLVASAIEAYELVVASATLRTGVFATALEAMNLAIFATPLGWAILAAGAIAAGGAYLLLSDNTTEAEKAAAKYAEQQKKSVEADALRAGVMEGSIAKSIQNYKDIDEARARGISLEEIKQEREIEFMQNAITREEELAVATVESENVKMQARMDTLKSYGITSGIEYDQLKTGIDKTLERIGTIRLLAQAHRTANADMIQELKDRAAAEAQYQKDHRKIPPAGTDTGPGKEDPRGLKAKENALQALNDAMTKFGKTTNDMENSLNKVTEAETFQTNAEILLEKAVKAGAITAEGSIQVKRILKQMAGERDLAEEAVEVNKITQAAQALNKKLDEQLIVRHKQTEAEALYAKLLELESGELTDAIRLEILMTKELLNSAKGKERQVAALSAYTKALENANKASSNITAHIAAMESVAKAESEMEAARAAALAKGPEYLAQLEAETAYREKQASSISDLKQKIEDLKQAEENLRNSGFKELIDPNALKNLEARLDALIGKTDQLATAAGNNAFQKSLTVDRDRIAGDLANAVMTGFDQGGQEAIRNLRDAITKEFLYKPIQVWIKATISEIMGGPATGNAATNASGGSLTGVGAMDSILGAANKMADTYLNGAKGTLGDIARSSTGTALGLNTANPLRYSPAADGMVANGTTLTTAGELFKNMPIGGMITAYTKGGTSGFVSGMVNTAAAGAITGGMAASAAGTGVMSGAMSGAGAALMNPYVLGFVALAAILGSGKGEYVKSLGESSVNYDAAGSLTGASGKIDRFGVDSSTSEKIAAGVAATYYDVAKSLGIKTSSLSVGYGANNSEGGKYQLGMSVGGKEVFNSGEVKSSEEGLKLSATQAVLSALKASELPTALKGMFDNIDIMALSQIDADMLMNDAKGFKAIADAADALPFNSLTNASHETLVALTAASGGLDKLTANLTTYYAAFYSESERNAKSTDKMAEEFKRLGIDVVPTTKEAFRALVESIGVATPEAAATTAALYAMSGSFAASVDAANAQMEAITGLNQSLGNVGAAMFSLNSTGYAAADGLAAAAGGLSQLQGLMSSYTSSYFTDAEQATMRINNVTADLNAAGINVTADQVGGASRQQIRDVVTQYGQNTGTAEGQKQYVTVLKAAQMLDQNLPKLASAVVSYGGGGGGGGGGGASPADSITDAWKTIVDSIWGEVKRIKGLIESTGIDAYGAAQAKFAMATASARAGDKTAAEALPDISKALLTLAESNTSTALELKMMQGYVAGSLTTTATQLSSQYGLTIPQFATGTNYVPQDMFAMIHEGEQIVPKAYNPNAGASGGGNSGEVVVEIRALRAQISAVQSRLASIDANAEKTAKTLVSVTENGKAMQTQAYV